MNKNRKLASIQRVWDIEPIDGADFIELVHVMGWQCVAKKGEFHKGDLCVYFEIDSFLPVDDPRYEFLAKGSLRKNELLGEGYYIKTRKFRGKYSQGLALPLSLFPEIKDPEVKEDVTELLGVRQWAEQEVMGNLGTICGSRPGFVLKTDELRVQSAPELREHLLGMPYYISTKMDGTSISVWYWDGELGVCGRNKRYADDGKSPLWQLVRDLHLDERLPELGNNVVLQGELCGPKIQNNRLKLKKSKWYVFNVFDRFDPLDLEDMKATCDFLSIDHVPIEETGDSFDYSMDSLIERAVGKYPSGQQKEGIVVRPITPVYDAILDKSLSFKVLNNKFLLK